MAGGGVEEAKGGHGEWNDENLSENVQMKLYEVPPITVKGDNNKLHYRFTGKDE